MAKRKRSSSIERKLKDGLGQGIRGGYKLWVKIQDIPLVLKNILLLETNYFILKI